MTRLVRLGERVAADPALADLDLAARDGLVDDRGADDLAVEDDGEVLADVGRREVGELVLALVLEREVDRAAARLVRTDRCGRRAGRLRTAAGYLVEIDLLVLRPSARRRAARSRAVRSCRRGSGSGPRSGRPASRRRCGPVPWGTTWGSATPELSIRLTMIFWRMDMSAAVGAFPSAGFTRYSTRRPPRRSRPSLVSSVRDTPFWPTAGRVSGTNATMQGHQADDDDQDRTGTTHRGGMIQGTG